MSQPETMPSAGEAVPGGSATNAQVRLAARPVGVPGPADWQHTTEPVPTPGQGEFLVRVSHLSLDPAMRGWMRDARSYIPPVALGAVMRAGGVGEVIASDHPGFAVGARVVGMFGVQSYAVSDGRGVSVIDPSLAPLPAYLGTLGMPGMTAYFGLLDVGAATAGDTVVVSAAAGAVGTVVGQIAKIKGCRVVGIAGGPDKCRFVVEKLGFDAAIDYRAGDVRPGLREHVPDGVDVYFDNVGGDILDAVLARLRLKGRVVICGAVSQYNAERPVPGPANYLSLLVNRARMEGFIVFDYLDRYPEALAALTGWLGEGRLRSKEDVVTGSVADFPATLLRLFRGENLGKLVLQVGPG